MTETDKLIRQINEHLQAQRSKRRIVAVTVYETAACLAMGAVLGWILLGMDYPL